jgi:hypothetical protein
VRVDLDRERQRRAALGLPPRIEDSRVLHEVAAVLRSADLGRMNKNAPVVASGAPKEADGAATTDHD